MNNNIKNPLVFLTRMLWRYSAGNRRMVVLYAAMSVAGNLIWSLEPLVVGLLLNEVQTKGVSEANTGYLILLLLAFLMVDVVSWGFHGPARVLEMKNAFFVKANYKKALLEGTMGLPIEWHVDHHSGDTIDKIEKGSNALFSFSENTFQVIQAVTVLVAGVVAMFYYNPTATVAVLALTIPTFFVLIIFDRKLVPGYKKVSLLENETSAKVFDIISNVTTVIILRIEPLVMKALDTAIMKPFRQFFANAKLNEVKWFSASVLGRLAAIAVIGIYLAQQLAGGVVLVGTLYILYGYVDRIRSVFFQFAYLYSDIVIYRARVSNAEELSKQFQAKRNSVENRISKTWNKLEIKNLSFSYGEEQTLHLSGISMEITKGERIAVIGESGGGKSTFLKVMRDLYHPKTLTLSVDGIELPEGFSAIENSISLVPQDPEIFSTTVRENITVGVEYPETHIAIFTGIAQFSDVVQRLPKGLESSIVEKGVNLSGGEKQRLALARGLLASEHKDIILLDEPTSSVDFANELKIYERLFEAFPDKSIISSIHRLHLLPMFNTIYLFKEGRIVAAGSFEHLKNDSPEFKELWERYLKAQASHGISS